MAVVVVDGVVCLAGRCFDRFVMLVVAMMTDTAAILEMTVAVPSTSAWMLPMQLVLLAGMRMVMQARLLMVLFVVVVAHVPRRAWCWQRQRRWR